MFIDRLFRTKDTHLTQLIVEDPFGQLRLDDIGTVEAVCSRAQYRTHTLFASAGLELRLNLPVHAIRPHYRGLLLLRGGADRGVHMVVAAKSPRQNAACSYVLDVVATHPCCCKPSSRLSIKTLTRSKRKPLHSW